MKLSEIDLLSIGNTVQIAGAVFAGEGKLLLCMFPDDRGSLTGAGTHFLPDTPGREPADEDLLEVHLLDMGQDDWQKFLRQTDILEVEVLERSSDGKLAKAVLRKSARQIESAISWQVFRRDGYACRYCGRDDVPLTVDHVVLWEEGGPSTPENLVSACKKCNKTRGRTKYPDWLRHPHYLRTSERLPEEVLERNRRLVETMASVPLRVNRKSR